MPTDTVAASRASITARRVNAVRIAIADLRELDPPPTVAQRQAVLSAAYWLTHTGELAEAAQS